MNLIFLIIVGLVGFLISFVIEWIIKKYSMSADLGKWDKLINISIKLSSTFIPILLFHHFDSILKTVMASIFSWSLLALVVIDIKQLILPDQITLPLLWVGILANSYQLFTSTQSAVFGVIVGYLSLWSIAKLYKFWRKLDGMGYGDFKLLAMLGAWLGVNKMIYILLISSFLGIMAGGLLIWFNSKTQSVSFFARNKLGSAAFKPSLKNTLIPFGPCLAMGGWMMLFCI